MQQITRTQKLRFLVAASLIGWVVIFGLALLLSAAARAQTACSYSSGTQTISAAFGACGTAKQNTDPDLTALAGLSGTGLVVRTGAGTYVERSLAAGTGLQWTDANGVAGNPGVSFQFSDQGASPGYSSDGCFPTNNATVPGNWVCEGDTQDTIETRIAITDPTGTDKTFTIPNADSVAVQPFTCSSTDKISAISISGVVTCSPDSGGGGGGGTWGSITGTLSSQTDLQTALDGKVNDTGDTMTGPFITAASGTGAAGLRVPHGTAPTTPVDGDIWSTASGLFLRVTGVTLQMPSLQQGNTYSSGQTMNGGAFIGASTTGNALLNKTPGVDPTTPTNGDIWTTSTAFKARINGATATLSGTNTGDQTITLTSDVTGSGTGSFATTIANNAVTNAKAADMANATLKCRTTAGTGDPEDCTTAQVNALLGTNGSAAFQGVLLTKSTNQFITGSATATWDVETYDNGAWHDNVTNNSRITVPTGVSRVRVTAVLRRASATDQLFARITKNGTNIDALGAGGADTDTTGNDTVNLTSAVLNVVPGDYFEIEVTMGVAADLALESWFAVDNVATGQGVVADADYGDVTVSSTGTVISVDPNAVALTTDTTGNYAAGDAEAGNALTGDSATAFFSAGAIEVARGGNGAAPGGDDQTLVSSSISAAAWLTIPDSDAAGTILGYDQATNAFTTKTDDDVPEVGDLTVIDTSSEMRTQITDEIGTGALMFGLVSTMADDLACTGSQVVRRNAGDTAFECASVAGTGDVVGPASATDNAITRFDTTTGKLVQNSAATIDDQGAIRSATNSGANAVSVPLLNYVMLTADYALSNVGTEQKAFNTTTNGRLTLPTGVYRFDCAMQITGMSATSGNASFDFVGGGTAVANRWGWTTVGNDATTSTSAAAISGSGGQVAQQSVGNVAGAAVNTALWFRPQGLFRVSTGGTVIPSITLTTAAAATMKAGSYCTVEKIGESGETTVGAWD